MSHPSYQMPLKAALMGYGYAGKLSHATLIDATPGLHLQIVGSNRSNVVYAERPDTTVCMPEAVATHADVDLVIVAAPSNHHVSLVGAALHASKHVVVDELFTITLAEAQHLAQVACDAGRALSAFQNRRWDSGFFAVQTAIGSGALGEAMHVEAYFDRYRPQVYACWHEQAGQDTDTWFDLGPHLIDQTLQLLGLPDVVSVSFARQRPGAEASDWAHVILDMGKRRAILHTSMLVVGGSPHWIVHGTRGSFVKRRMGQQEARLLTGMKPDAQGWGVDDDTGVLINGTTSTETRVMTPAGNQHAYYTAVCDAIFGQRANPVPPVQVVSIMVMLEATVATTEIGMVVVSDLTDTGHADWLAAWETAS